MKNISSYNNVTWVDLVNPTPEEINEVATSFNLAPRTISELSANITRPLVNFQDDYIYLVLHFPDTNTDYVEQTRDKQEIDFIIHKEALITVRNSVMVDLEVFRKNIETNNFLDRNDYGNTGWMLFYHLVEFLYANTSAHLEEISERLKEIETRIFEGSETNIIERISKENRRLLEHKRALYFHKIAFTDLDRRAHEIFEGHFTRALDKLIRTYHDLMSELSTNKEILDDLRQTNEMLLNTKTNNVMQGITLVTFIAGPLIVGFELLKSPIEKIEYSNFGIFLIIFGTVCTVAFLWFYFKRKKFL